MYSQSTMDARARQAYEDAELWRCPLRRRRVAVAAEGVAGLLLDGEELLNEATSANRVRKGERVEQAGRSVRVLLSLSSQLQHTLERVSGSTSHMAFEAMLGKLLVFLSSQDSPKSNLENETCGSCGSRGSFRWIRQGTKVDKDGKTKAREGLVDCGSIRANLPVEIAPLRLGSYFRRGCFDLV